MPFKTKEYLKMEFSPRTADVLLPDLKDWFDGDPIWKVRGLQGIELGRCNELAEKNRKTIADIAEGLISNRSDELIETVRCLVGLSENVPMEIAKGLEYLICGSVDPECDLDLALKLNTTFPVEFRQLVSAILELTGKGHIPAGKSKPSGIEPISE